MITQPTRRRTLVLVPAVLAAALAGACSDGAQTPSETTLPTSATPATDPTAVDAREVQIADTTLAVQVRGTGPALLLVHGGGEDATMLAGQAESLAAAGYQVITYDRRGTGGSGRENWPGSGADQHADDAAALLDALDVDSATVLGLSVGGVIALDLAARHPERVDQVIAWETPAIGMVPGGAEINDQMMAPVEAHLADHPGDFVGAQAIILSTILGFPVTADDPAFEAARANAKPMIRDDPTVALKQFTEDDFGAVPTTMALGSSPLDFMVTAAEQIAAWVGTSPVRVEADHEVYLSDPQVLTDLVVSLPRAA